MAKKPKKSTASVETADRDFVLTTAAKLFRNNGYERTTVKQVAEACEMLPGSLHYRYNSKEAILLDMMRLGLSRVTEELIFAFRSSDRPEEKLRQGISAHLRMLVLDSDMVYVLLFEWRSLTGESRIEMIELRDRYEQIWAEMLAHLVKENVIRKDVDLDLLRLIGLGAINWVATWYKTDGKYRLEDIGDFIWKIFSGGIIVKN